MKRSFLVDTNVWLERLLEQEKAGEVASFLSKTPSSDISISDFTLHSIGIILTKLNKSEIFLQFIDDLFLEGDVSLIHLEPNDMEKVVKTAIKFDLDFDDAYQYVASEKYKLILVSFDQDFDRTEKGKKTPAEV